MSESRRAAARKAYGQWSQLKNMIHGADVVVEVVDARDVSGTRLPIAERWCGSKRLLAVANKADLLPEGADRPALQNKGIWISAKEGGERGRRTLMESILSRTERRPAKALFIGYPNVGKSSLINLLAGRKAAKVSPVAGTTKNIQWVRINDELMASDYRGLYPAHEKEADLIRKGARNVDDSHEAFAFDFAQKALGNPTLLRWLEGRYDVALAGAADGEDVIRRIALRRGWVLKGGEPNMSEAAKHILRARREAPEF